MNTTDEQLQRGSGDSVDPAPTETWRVPTEGGEVTVARWSGRSRPRSNEARADIVLLHDGLGSIQQWRSIPAALAERTGRTVVAYDRPGHGDSTPIPRGAWPTDWLHVEAERFANLLSGMNVVDEPLIVGHSDGGSIALLYGAETSDPIRGIVTLAAHSWVERTCLDAIVGMREDAAPIIRSLGRDHPYPEAVFGAWSGVWVSDEFQSWDIRPLLSTIGCPTLVVQGRDDEYALQSHAVETAAAIGHNAQHLIVDGVGHLLHHQDPNMVVELIAEVDRTLG